MKKTILFLRKRKELIDIYVSQKILPSKIQRKMEAFFFYVKMLKG